MKKIPFYMPLIDQSEENFIKEVLIQKGASKIEELEDLMCEYTGSEYAISTSSWSGAMHLSMFTLNLKRGDKILCSVNSHPAVAEAVRHFDAEPIFVDIDENTLNMSVDALKKSLVEHKHKKLKAVIVSHIGGISADLKEIYKIAKENKIEVIEDASTSMGAKYEGQMIGNTGATLTTFAFNPNEQNNIVNTGVITTNNKELYERAKLLRHHGIISDKWDSNGNLGYVYDVEEIGIEYETSELESAFCIAKLQKMDEIIDRRRDIASIYFEELKDTPHITLPIKSKEHTYELFTIKIDKNRDDFARHMLEFGVYTGLYYVPMHLLSYYKQKYNLKVNDFPTALTTFQQILSIPCYAKMTNEEVLYVCDVIKKVASNRV